MVHSYGLEDLKANGYEARGEYAIFQNKIVQSPNDECKYRLIRLRNGLEIMIAQNHRAEKVRPARK